MKKSAEIVLTITVWTASMLPINLKYIFITKVEVNDLKSTLIYTLYYIRNIEIKPKMFATSSSDRDVIITCNLRLAHASLPN